jgi:hypothetical protein
VPINEWWVDDPAQRYWMEITNRDDLGGELRAPQKSDDGHLEWGYELVRFAQPGDVVLHWYTRHEPRELVGYSRVAGPVRAGMWTWASKGTSGRARLTPEVDEPAWMTPLTDFTYFSHRITRDQLQGYKAAVLDLKDRLQEAYGAHLYYPFYLYGARELRATQAYLTKFPAQLLPVFALDKELGRQAADSAVEPSRRSTRGSGYLKDVEVKRAIERHAVWTARAYFEAQGYTCQDVGTTRSYDLHLMKGPDEVHVEVKGSTGIATTVELTSNEVSHSYSTSWQTQLIVVDQIAWTRTSGEVVTSGGRMRIWPTWRAELDRLRATRYRYQLPDQEVNGG